MHSIFGIMKKYGPIAFWMILIVACRYEFPRGSLLHVSDGKTAAIDRKTMMNDSARKECIRYEYDGLNKLYFTHENRRLNCSPGKITADIFVESDTIFISEQSSRDKGDRFCFYNLEYVIDNLEEGAYTLKMAHLNNFEAEIDLTVSYSGSYCDIRTPDDIHEN